MSSIGLGTDRCHGVHSVPYTEKIFSMWIYACKVDVLRLGRSSVLDATCGPLA